jgi:hypothetical protein
MIACAPEIIVVLSRAQADLKVRLYDNFTDLKVRLYDNLTDLKVRPYDDFYDLYDSLSDRNRRGYRPNM